MTEKYQPLYCDMLKDIARCEQLELPDAEWVVSCFWVAHNYWERLKKLINPKSFRNEDEEIDFFRNVKPQFTAHIEYFVILSEALTCVPDNCGDALYYWEEEGKRLNRFCERNEDFVRYYESGERCRDNSYFLRGKASMNYKSKRPVYDADPDYYTSHDLYVMRYLAFKMYWEYCKKRIELLAGCQESK